MDIATGKKPRLAEVDQFAQAFSVAGEKQETVADEATAAFSQAQAVEEKFHHDFDGVDFIDTSLCYGGA